MIGLMGAMPEEMDKVIAAITEKNILERGSRLYYFGKLYGKEVVAVRQDFFTFLCVSLSGCRGRWGG